jgi:hypothetical protein
MTTRKLPTADEAWAAVHAFATRCAAHARPVFTLQRTVRNIITDVGPTTIGRESAKGRTNKRKVTLGQVQRVWGALCNGQSWKDGGNILYFTPALMLAAMPEHLEDLGGGDIGLSAHPAVRKKKQERIAGLGHAAGGEGELHRALRLFIHRDPNSALKRIGGGPWTPFATEYVFGTGDRVDVYLRDRDGKFVLVEVKPHLETGDPAPFAQAAKYRTLMHILDGRDLDSIRTIVAAPKIPKRLAKQMFDRHGVESVKVTLPESE